MLKNRCCVILIVAEFIKNIKSDKITYKETLIVLVLFCCANPVLNRAGFFIIFVENKTYMFNIKLSPTIVMIVVIILLGIGNIVFFNMQRNAKKENRTLTETVMASQDTLREMRDREGKLYKEKEALVIDYRLIRRSNDALI